MTTVDEYAIPNTIDPKLAVEKKIKDVIDCYQKEIDKYTKEYHQCGPSEAGQKSARLTFILENEKLKLHLELMLELAQAL